ncbi:hypothetical protein ACFSTH_18265 [Paenibacillus yanchengensis]|uniref:Uncharacterized protein n=1 Tax=Paenibacillus yanchengensis TaxID=2035833 RepID=A0ABW4YP88_9BACL
MDNKLLIDTVALVNDYIHKQTDIKLDISDRSLQELADLIGNYQMTRSRKMTVLSCCMLLSAGIRKHSKLPDQSQKQLARKILDGDYLIGLIYKLAISRKEQKLLTKLTPIYKKVQLQVVKGLPVEEVMTELKQEIKVYMEQQSA